jgi:hypothetical protein
MLKLCTALVAAAFLFASTAEGAEVPPQYRGLWCELPNSNGDVHRRCREADSEGYLDIRRNSIGDFGENTGGPCRVHNATPFKNSHRIAVRCSQAWALTDQWLVAINLRLDGRGRLQSDFEYLSMPRSPT